jgi:PAS domain S-box-containing protein
VVTAKWFLPDQKFTDRTATLFDGIRDLFKDLLNVKIEFEHFKDGQTVQELLSGVKNGITFVTLYESIYLETSHKFIPLFKIKTSLHNGVLAIPEESDVKHLCDLVGKKILIHQGMDLTCINPVIAYLVKNCEIVIAPKSFLAYTDSDFQIDQLLKNDFAAILSKTFNYHLLAENSSQKLKIIGQFPVESEFIAIAASGFNIGKVHNELENWCKKQNQDHLASGFIFAPIEKSDNTLLIEAIEGLGYNTKNFIEQYSSQIIKAITDTQIEEIKTLSEKYNGLQVFNEKLINMYKEIRDSRDRLYKEIDTATDNLIVFLKDGTIIGISRGFINWVHQSRQDIIGKNIADFISPNMNKSFRELIQQVDYGLIKSFGVRLVKDGGESNPAKIDFAMIELQDSKIILGIINKKITKGI